MGRVLRVVENVCTDSLIKETLKYKTQKHSLPKTSIPLSVGKYMSTRQNLRISGNLRKFTDTCKWEKRNLPGLNNIIPSESALIESSSVVANKLVQWIEMSLCFEGYDNQRICCVQKKSINWNSEWDVPAETMNRCKVLWTSTDSWLYCAYLYAFSLFGQNMTWRSFWCHLSRSTWKVFFNQQVKKRVMKWHSCVGKIANKCLVGLWVFWYHWSVLSI